MIEITDAEIEIARRNGDIEWATQPRAVSARYDRERGQVVIELASGCVFSFPTAIVQGLEGASPENLAEVEVIGHGHGLHWETLNEDYSVPGLLAGRFGTAKFMAARAAELLTGDLRGRDHL